MKTLLRIGLVGFCVVCSGCMSFQLQKSQDTRQDLTRTQSALSTLPAADLALRVDTNRPLVLTNGIALKPAVAYEWLAARYDEEQKADDAAIALLMSSLLYVQQPGDTHTPTAVSVFERAKELHLGAAVREGLADIPKPAEGESLALADVLKIIGQAAGRPAVMKDPVFAQSARTYFQIHLQPVPQNNNKTPLQYRTGDPAFLSALGLAWMQQPDDMPYVERYLASDPEMPIFYGYIQAMAATNAALRDRLLGHPSSAVRANTLMALRLPAAAGETDALIRAAGAVPVRKETAGQDVQTLKALLSDERHMVRKLALSGLLSHRAEISRAELETAMTTTPAWVKKYVGMVASSVGGTFRINAISDGATNSYRDESLCLAAYPLMGCVSNLGASDFQWLIDQLRPDPPISTPIVFSSADDTAEGYRAEILETVSSEKVNAGLAQVLKQKAPQHPDLLLAALRKSTPFARLYLIQAAAGVATNPAIRAELWKIVEGARPADEKAYKKALEDKIADEVRASLLYNQTVNYGGIQAGVTKIMDNIQLLSRQQALSALSPCAGELDRVAKLRDEAAMARATLPIFLANGRDAILKQVPAVTSAEYARADSESRLVMALLHLTVQDDPAVRAALAGALDTEDQVVFACRIALALKQPAVRQVILDAARVPSFSLAGHLVRRLAAQRMPTQAGMIEAQKPNPAAAPVATHP